MHAGWAMEVLGLFWGVCNNIACLPRQKSWQSMLYACNQTLALIGLSHIACAVLLRAHMKKFSINRAFIIFSHFGADWVQVGKARTDERLCW
jgi:hypothetical protein